MAKQLDKKFIGNDQVDGDKLKLLVGQTIRQDDGAGGSIDVLATIDASITAAQSDADANGVALASEIMRATGVEGGLDSRLVITEQYVSTLQIDMNNAELAISNEVMRATGVEGGLDSRLVTAEGEINVLQFDLDAAELAIANEVMRATGVEGGIDSRLVTAEGEINVLQFDLDANELALANEIMRATGIEGGIDSRLVTAEGEINVLQFDLDAAELAISNEVMRATGVEGSLQTQITALTGGTSGSIATVQAALTQEIADREAADAVLQTQIDNVLSNVDGAALDSLSEIVTAFQAADSSLNGAITALSTGLSADIAAEETARMDADAILQGSIDQLITDLDAEVTRAQNAEIDIMAEVNTNSTVANDRWTLTQANDAAIDARVDILESVTWKKQKFAMSNGQISISLAFTPVAGSVSMFVDQVPMHESIDAGASDDFSVSGSSVSFINDFSSTGNKKMQNNDTVYVKYQYKA